MVREDSPEVARCRAAVAEANAQNTKRDKFADDAPEVALCRAIVAEAKAQKTKRKRRKGASEAQKEAARQNGKNSQGPTSTEGKERSKQNATKHGMAGNGTVLPEEIQTDYQLELDLFRRDLKPENHVETRLVEQAALASARWVHLMRSSVAASTERARHAVDDWDDRRRAEVDKWAKALNPKSTENPAEAVAQLRRTSAGCRRLALEYQNVGNAMEKMSGFTEEFVATLMRLLGETRDTPRYHEGGTMRQIWTCIYAVRIEFNRLADYKFGAVFNLTEEDMYAALPPAEEALAWLIAWAKRKRRAFLRRSRDLAERFDEPDRAGALDQSAFDPSPVEKLRHRYLVDANRMFRMSLTQLNQLRKRRDSDRAPSLDDRPFTTSPKRTAEPPPKSPQMQAAKVFEARQSEGANRLNSALKTAAPAPPLPDAEQEEHQSHAEHGNGHFAALCGQANPPKSPSSDDDLRDDS